MSSEYNANQIQVLEGLEAVDLIEFIDVGNSLMGRGGRPEIEAIKFAETEMVQTQDAGVAAPVKGLLRRLPLQEGAQAAAEGVPQFLRDAVAAELLVGDRGQKRAAESGLKL